MMNRRTFGGAVAACAHDRRTPKTGDSFRYDMTKAVVLKVA